MENNMGNSAIPSAMRAPTLEEERERLTPSIKELRKSIDALIEVNSYQYGQERTGKEIIINDFKTKEVQKIVALKLTEAKMWAGKMLESLGSPFPKELADKAE